MLAQRMARLLMIVREEYVLFMEGSSATREEEYQESLQFFHQAQEVSSHLSFYPSLTKGLSVLQKQLEDRLPARVIESTVYSLHRLLEKFTGPLPWRLPSGVDISLGSRLYEGNCRGCHGPPPEEIGGFHPPNLFSLSFLQDKSPAQLFTLITEGVPGSPMPPFGEPLSESERWSVVAHLFLMGQSKEAVTEKGRRLESLLPPSWNSYPPEKLLLIKPETLLHQLEEIHIPKPQRLALAQWVILQPFLASSPDSVQEILRMTQEQWIQTLRHIEIQVKAGNFEGASTALHDLYMEFEENESLFQISFSSTTRKMETLFHHLFEGMKTPGSFHKTVEELISTLKQLTPRTSEKLPSHWVVFQSFLIIFREGLETLLILAAIFAYLRRIHQTKLYRPVSTGMWLGLLLTGTSALLAQTLFTALRDYREGLEGFTLLLAAVILFTVSFWLISRSLAQNWQKYIQKQVHQALEKGNRWALPFVAFLAVYREGLETILFYQALFFYSRNYFFLFIGLAMGLLVLFFIILLFYRFMLKLPLRIFFTLTSLFLYGMSFSFIGKGIQELQDMGWVGTTLLSGFPTVGILGLYPTLETVVAQGVLLAVSAFLILRFYRRMVRSLSPS